MQIIQTTLSIMPETLAQIRRLLPCAPEKACFFDIETTGLSPKISNVYLIGAAFLKGDRAELIQWFADDYVSEASLLTAFSDSLASCDTVIHYNGSTFDIPYLTKKYIEHGLPDPFLKVESLDLYREINHFCKKHTASAFAAETATAKPAEPKKGGRKSPTVFHTDNLKLNTMEKLVGFDRGQDFSGKECIALYAEYMQEKYAHHDEHRDELKGALLSHNHDDLVGTCLVTQLLSYTRHTPNTPSLTLTDDAAILTDTFSTGLSYPFPLTLQASSSDKKEQNDSPDENTAITITYENNILTIHIPLYRGTLYHFFPDYKNYYYLPDEDMAIHKSVGTYVDKEHRQQATAANCYVPKAGEFIPVPSGFVTEQPIFHKKNAPKGACYIESHSASAVEMISFLL